MNLCQGAKRFPHVTFLKMYSITLQHSQLSHTCRWTQNNIHVLADVVLYWSNTSLSQNGVSLIIKKKIDNIIISSEYFSYIWVFVRHLVLCFKEDFCCCCHSWWQRGNCCDQTLFCFVFCIAATFEIYFYHLTYPPQCHHRPPGLYIAPFWEPLT